MPGTPTPARRPRGPRKHLLQQRRHRVILPFLAYRPVPRHLRFDLVRQLRIRPLGKSHLIIPLSALFAPKGHFCSHLPNASQSGSERACSSLLSFFQLPVKSTRAPSACGAASVPGPERCTSQAADIHSCLGRQSAKVPLQQHAP